MVVFLNGEFVAEAKATVSVFDRGFLYGDGLFEAVRVFNGRLFRWRQHLERLQRGAEFLHLSLPFFPEALHAAAQQLIQTNQMPDSLLRVTLSRGVGVRGYSPKGAERPTLVMSLHPAPAVLPHSPPQWDLVSSTYRLPANEALAQFKTCNKLPQVLARAEADASGAQEALLMNTDGFVVEGASSNLFWISGETICTPPLTSGVLAGVTRAIIFELCAKVGYPVREETVQHAQLLQSNGLFLSLTSVGIAEGISVDRKPLARSPMATTLSEAYWAVVQSETS
jgi:branched-chain amino acid aminotransferase